MNTANWFTAPVQARAGKLMPGFLLYLSSGRVLPSGREERGYRIPRAAREPPGLSVSLQGAPVEHANNTNSVAFHAVEPSKL